MVKIKEVDISEISFNTSGSTRWYKNYDIKLEVGMLLTSDDGEFSSNISRIQLGKKNTIWVYFDDEDDTVLPLKEVASQIETGDLKRELD